MKFNDVSLGILLMLAGGAIWLSAQQFSRLPNQAYGSETMPLALSAVAVILGVFMVGRSLVAGGRWPSVSRAEWTLARGAVAGFVAVIGLILAYIVLADRLGFLPVAVAVIWSLMVVMRVRWWLAGVLSFVAALAIQQAFGRLLLVPLPRTEYLQFIW
jgi:hypothetical protein